ncbi:MAG: hypothetical protein ACR2OZ_18130 [Verrucomicrobiales bacterium]
MNDLRREPRLTPIGQRPMPPPGGTGVSPVNVSGGSPLEDQLHRYG